MQNSEETKDTIVFYKSFYDCIKELPSENQIEVYNAIFKKYFYDEDIELDGLSKGIFSIIIPNINSANKRYWANVKNGKKGGRPKTEKPPKQNPNNNPNITQIEPKQNLKDKEKDKDKVNDNVNDNIYNIDRLGQIDTIDDAKITYEDRFNALWEIYPRKEGKVNAFKKFKKICKNVNDDDIKTGILKYIKYIQENKIEKQYIKQGSTWFNGECWNDEYNLGGDTSVSGYSRI